MPRPLWIALLLFNLPCVRLTAQSAPDLLARLSAAAQISDLSDATLKPWHLKVEFDLLDAKGAVREHGALEQWWAAPDRFRITVTSPSYTATETRQGDKAFQTIGQLRRPELDELIVAQVDDPLREVSNLKGVSPVFEKKAFGKVDLDCIMPAPTGDRTHPWLGLYTTYCFDPGKPDLRIVIRYRDQFIVRNRVARFQDHDIALDLNVLDAGKVVLKSHVAELRTYTPGEHDFDPTPEQQAVAMPAPMGSAVMAGALVSKVTPTYPLQARQEHISGVVVLHAIIGKDGHVKEVSPIRSPDKRLTAAAMDAVRQWTYKPYLLEGEPIEVETTITVNFNMG